MKIGFVVNPVAGAGGRIGLKGSDDVDAVLKKGGRPSSPVIAEKFCRFIGREMEVITCSSSMGRDYINGRVVYEVNGKTTAKDTIKACRAFVKHGADLIVFVGGDGTARDVYGAVGKDVPILGVPAGVKMYSSVFAFNAEKAAHVVREFAEGKTELMEREIMDVDEEAFRNDMLKIKLHGFAIVPSLRHFIQNGKKMFAGEEHAKREVAEFMALVCKRGTCILGPGSTVKAIADEMGVEKTLLGVDVMRDGKIIARDAGEREILDAMNGSARIVVSPMGGNNFIFGRGNQQISARVIKKAGIENVTVVATPAKMMEAPFLYVDVGDEAMNKKLAGWRQVIVGYGMAVRKKVLF